MGTVQTRSFVAEGGNYRLEDLREVACELNKKGFPINEHACASDVFAVVRQYQESVGLTPDGKVGDATWSALLFDIRTVREGKRIVAKQLAEVPHQITDDFDIDLERMPCASGQDLAAAARQASGADDGPVASRGEGSSNAPSQGPGSNWLAPLGATAGLTSQHFFRGGSTSGAAAPVSNERAVVPYRASNAPAKVEPKIASGDRVTAAPPRTQASAASAASAVNMPKAQNASSPKPASVPSPVAAQSGTQYKVGDLVAVPGPKNSVVVAQVTAVDGDTLTLKPRSESADPVKWSKSRVTMATPEQARQFQGASRQQPATPNPGGQKGLPASNLFADYKVGDQVKYGNYTGVVEGFDPSGKIRVKFGGGTTQYFSNPAQLSKVSTSGAVNNPQNTSQVKTGVNGRQVAGKALGTAGVALTAYNAYRTLNDPNASGLEKTWSMLTVGATTAGVALSRRYPGVGVALGWTGLGSSVAQNVQSRYR